MKWSVPSRQKLIAFLQGKLGKEHSGKFLRKLLELNLCRINGKIERFGSKTVEAGSVVELAPNWKDFLESKVAPIETIYEDEDLLIINKAAGFVCTDEVLRKSLGSKRFLVHRLDKMTTGLLIIAKSAKVRDALIELFEKKAIEKKYLAVVDGIVKQNEGVKNTLFAKKGSFEGQTIWGSAPKGIPAVTYWKVLARGKKASLMLCEPVTGRTHQIRVHMAELGHPILTDRQYAKHFQCTLFAARPLLHAYELTFVFKGKQISVQAPIPADMIAFCKNADLNC